MNLNERKVGARSVGATSGLLAEVRDNVIMGQPSPDDGAVAESGETLPRLPIRYRVASTTMVGAAANTCRTAAKMGATLPPGTQLRNRNGLLVRASVSRNGSHAGPRNRGVPLQAASRRTGSGR